MKKTGIALLASCCLFQIVSCKTSENASEEKDRALRSQFEFILENFRPNQIKQIAQDQYQRFKISVSSRIFKLDLMDSANLSGRYRYELKQAAEGTHLRVDQWRLGLGLIPGLELVGGPAPLALNLNITIDSDVNFSRVYTSKKQAALATPRTLLDLPVNHGKAMDSNIGEKVTMPLTMGVRVGPTAGWDIENFGLSASTGVFWAGSFILEIARIDEAMFSLKVIPSEKWGLNINSFAGYELDYFGYGPRELFSFDKVVSKELGLDFFKFSMNRVNQGRSSQLQYIYNLSNRDAKRAFDHALNAVMRVSAQTKALLKPGLMNLADLYFMDFGPSEALTTRDQNRDHLDRRVSAGDVLTNNYFGKSLSNQIGTKLLRFRQGAALSFHELQTFHSERLVSNTYLHHLVLERKRTSFWAPAREGDDIQASGITREMMITTGSKTSSYFVFNWNKGDANLSNAEFKSYVYAVKNIINLDDKDPLLAMGAENFSKVRANLRVQIAENVFEKMQDDALHTPNRFKQNLMNVLNRLYLRYDKRFGINTPGPPQNFADRIRGNLIASMAQFKNLLHSSIKLRWGSASQKAFFDAAEIIEGYASEDVIEMQGKLLKLMNEQPVAVEIVPALLLQMSDEYQIAPSISFNMTSDSKVISRYEEGSDHYESDYRQLMQVYSTLGRLE